MSKTSSSETYFETLGAALAAHIAKVESLGGVFEDNTEEMYCFFPPVSYGQTQYDHRALATYKGKGTKKYAHAAIYRMETGRYELTSYIA
jgi:hypothetical protein